MYCPECKSENSDSAKFCKKCGTPLKSNEVSHKKMINSMSNESSGTDTTKIIIIALIVVAVVLAGAFVYLYGFSNDNQAQDNSQDNDAQVQSSNEPAQATQTSSSNPTSAMTIKGGSFSTGSSLSDKTYASIYVGSEFAGENIIIQIFYSRDGSALNDGNMVPKTVDSSGYIEVASAEPYSYYPDYATINLYDSSSNLLDTQSVSLSPSSGTQSF